MSSPIRAHEAVMYALDGRGRVLCTRPLPYNSDAEMRRLAKAELAHAAAVEVWVESICMLRLWASDGLG